MECCSKNVDWTAQDSKKKKKKKKIVGEKRKKKKILSMKPHTQKVWTSTGIFWLKHIFAPHYKHFTI